MLLKLLVKNKKGEYNYFAEEEINVPNYPELPFRDNHDLRKMYVDKMVEKLKIRYQRILEDKDWQIIMEVESKFKEDQILKIA